jgi:hypothetical protein
MERVSLSPEHAKRASIIGAICHVMFAGGAWLGLSSGILLFAVALSSPDETELITQEGYGLDAATGTLLVVLAIVVGLGLQVSAVLLSFRWLKLGGFRAPWGITWSALGISVAIDLLLTNVLTVVNIFTRAGDSTLVGIISVVVSLIVVGFVGAFIWRWMASAFRAPAPTVEPVPTS